MASLAADTAPVRIVCGALAPSATRSDLGPGRLVRLIVATVVVCSLAGPLASSAHAEPAWTTYHRDQGRSGNDPDAVEPIVPIQAWQSATLSGSIHGQPLVLGQRVYVATTRDKLYALDASSGEIVWRKSAGTPVPSGELPCGNISPTVGIVGTPVIDVSAQVIYAVADTWHKTEKRAQHVLKGFRLATGENVLSTPVDPSGDDPKALLERTALNLDKGRIVFGFGGNYGDCGNYRGTVVSAPESGGTPTFWRYQPAPPSTTGGAVWGPSGPAIDGEGHVYAATGNPDPPEAAKAETYDYSDSVIELDSSLNLIGSFKPATWLSDSNNDVDLGSAGSELLSGGVLFQAGKNGTGYLINEATMGSAAKALYSAQVCAGHGSFGGDAYAGGVIYIPCTNGVQALSYNQTAHTFTSLWQGPSDAFGSPIVSGGLIWVIATGGFSGGGTKLYGIVPSSGATRYTETLPSPVADHFGSPSAAGGRLFVASAGASRRCWRASGSSVTAYQIARLTSAGPTITDVTPAKGPVGGGTTVTIAGANLGGATSVKFGATAAASFVVNSATQITAVSPAEAAGAVDVIATTPSGTSATSLKDRFKFLPTVTGLSPVSGTRAGGTSVTVTGTGFLVGNTATIFKFGSIQAASVNCTSTTKCTAVSPAHEVGTVDVKATVNKVSSVKNAPGDRFTFN
jgi:outer membrane protein assembly factor BamB